MNKYLLFNVSIILFDRRFNVLLYFFLLGHVSVNKTSSSRVYAGVETETGEAMPTIEIAIRYVSSLI